MKRRPHPRGTISFLPAAVPFEDPPFADLPFVDPMLVDDGFHRDTARISRRICMHRVRFILLFASFSAPFLCPPLEAQYLRVPDTLGVRFTPWQGWLEVGDSTDGILHVFTFECWIRLRDSGVIASRDAHADTTSDWQIQYDARRNRIALVMHYGRADEYYYSPDSTVPPQVWTHIALQVNGPDGYARVYRNGMNLCEFHFASRHFDARTGFALGGYYREYGRGIDCDLTEARYWCVERDADQILRYWRRRIPREERLGLRGYWMFRRSYADSSGWNNHLHLSYGASVSFIPIMDPREGFVFDDPPEQGTEAHASREALIRAFRNFPNPFRGETLFEIQLSRSAVCTLRIYDCIGRRTILLQGGELSAGVHFVRFRDPGPPGGMYFASLTTPEETVVRRIVPIGK